MTSKLVDYSTKDYEGFREDLIKGLKEAIPEYTDFSQSDAGIVLIELLAHGLDICSYYNDVVANESILSTAKQRESVINLIRPYNYAIKNATPSRVYQVFEVDSSKGDVVIPLGTQISTKSLSSEESLIFETEEDLVIPQGKTGLEQDGIEGYTYKVSCIQGYSVAGEVLGTSTEVADQKFKLSYPKAIDSTISVFVDEGQGPYKWTKVDSFIDSDVDSQHYMLYYDNAENCYIQFGNGLSGRIPSQYRNGIVACYRVGGGLEGNVAPKSITELINPLAVIKNTFNPESPYELAEDRESVESAKTNAPKCLRTLARAVTLEDFRDLAVLTRGVLKANSINNKDTGKIDVVILPTSLNDISASLKAELESMYDDKALLGVEVEVKSFETTSVNISLDVKVYANYVAKEVKADVKSTVESLFELGTRDFGEEVVLGSIISKLMTLDGVKSIGINTPTSDVEIDQYHIPVLGTLTINTVGGVSND